MPTSKKVCTALIGLFIREMTNQETFWFWSRCQYKFVRNSRFYWTQSLRIELLTCSWCGRWTYIFLYNISIKFYFFNWHSHYSKIELACSIKPWAEIERFFFTYGFERFTVLAKINKPAQRIKYSYIKHHLLFHILSLYFKWAIKWGIFHIVELRKCYENHCLQMFNFTVLVCSEVAFPCKSFRLFPNFDVVVCCFFPFFFRFIWTALSFAGFVNIYYHVIVIFLKVIDVIRVT